MSVDPRRVEHIATSLESYALEISDGFVRVNALPQLMCDAAVLLRWQACGLSAEDVDAIANDLWPMLAGDRAFLKDQREFARRLGRYEGDA